MSEIDNSTLVESALEMQPLEQEPAVAVEAISETPTPAISNQEAMTTLVLSRVKKQSKQLENLTRLLGQVPAQFRNAERKQARQSKLISQQLRVLQNQVRQIQKQVARIKAPSTSPRKRKAKRKATKSRARRR